MASQYFLRRGKKSVGPVVVRHIEKNIAKGRVLATDQICETRYGPWQAVGRLPEFAPLFADTQTSQAPSGRQDGRLINPRGGLGRLPHEGECPNNLSQMVTSLRLKQGSGELGKRAFRLFKRDFFDLDWGQQRAVVEAEEVLLHDRFLELISSIRGPVTLPRNPAAGPSVTMVPAKQNVSHDELESKTNQSPSLNTVGGLASIPFSGGYPHYLSRLVASLRGKEQYHKLTKRSKSLFRRPFFQLNEQQQAVVIEAEEVVLHERFPELISSVVAMEAAKRRVAADQIADAHAAQLAQPPLVNKAGGLGRLPSEDEYPKLLSRLVRSLSAKQRSGKLDFHARGLFKREFLDLATEQQWIVVETEQVVLRERFSELISAVSASTKSTEIVTDKPPVIQDAAKEETVRSEEHDRERINSRGGLGRIPADGEYPQEFFGLVSSLRSKQVRARSFRLLSNVHGKQEIGYLDASAQRLFMRGFFDLDAQQQQIVVEGENVKSHEKLLELIGVFSSATKGDETEALRDRAAKEVVAKDVLEVVVAADDIVETPSGVTHSRIRESIARLFSEKVVASGEVAAAYALAAHPWPDGAVSREALDTIAKETVQAEGFYLDSSRGEAIERLTRFAECLDQASQTAMSARFWEASAYLQASTLTVPIETESSSLSLEGDVVKQLPNSIEIGARRRAGEVLETPDAYESDSVSADGEGEDEDDDSLEGLFELDP